jgi:hypothetical protein
MINEKVHYTYYTQLAVTLAAVLRLGAVTLTASLSYMPKCEIPYFM